MRTNSFFRPRVRLFSPLPGRRGASVSHVCAADLAYMAGMHSLVCHRAFLSFSPLFALVLVASLASHVTHTCKRAARLPASHMCMHMYHARVQLVSHVTYWLRAHLSAMRRISLYRTRYRFQMTQNQSTNSADKFFSSNLYRLLIHV